MTPDQINDQANWVALASIIPFLAGTVIYGTRAPWYKSLLGVSMFGVWSSITLVLAFNISRRFFGEWLGYHLVAWGVYSYLFLAGFGILASLIVELRRGGVLIIPINRKRD